MPHNRLENYELLLTFAVLYEDIHVYAFTSYLQYCSLPVLWSESSGRIGTGNSPPNVDLRDNGNGFGGHDECPATASLV